MRRPAPGHLNRQEIGGVECEQIEFPPIVSTHGGQTRKRKDVSEPVSREYRALRSSGDRVQEALAPV